jgi:EAL domain-containing protein (putative c-di-GMP-specific phosphodiesterase class I)
MLLPAADDAITLNYQPFADNQGNILGFEALMRWHHLKRGPISPEAFIPVFENCGLILPLSRWALKQACIDAVCWRRPLRVAVNLSPVQFEQDDVLAIVGAVLNDTNLAAERLELEITEHAFVGNPEVSGPVLLKLADLGVRLVLDDVAAGVALPFHLQDFPFSKIKIARSIVENVEVSAAARSIVHMIVLVGRSMNVPVAATGIETAGQLAILIKQGCEGIQGFFLGRPAAMSTFVATTGNLPADFTPGATRLANGVHLIVPVQGTVPVRFQSNELADMARPA